MQTPLLTQTKPTPPATPRKHQAVVIEEHVKSFKKGNKSRKGAPFNARIDGSDMGTGKTYIALFTAQRLGMPVSIICPKTSISVWLTAMAAVKVEGVLFIHNYEKLIRSELPYFKCYDKMSVDREYAAAMADYEEACLKAGVAAIRIMPPVRRKVEDKTFIADIPDNTFVIVDEVHRAKGADTSTGEMLVALAKWNRAKPLSRPVLALSATKAASAADMRGLGFLLGLHELEDFETWATINGCSADSWGKMQYYGGDEGLKELHRQIYPSRGSRIRIADLPKGAFPETLISAKPFDMGKDAKKIARIYEEMDRELDRYMSGLTANGNPLTIILRARQKVELLKVPTFVELAQDAIDEGRRVLIFVNFKETLLALKKRLKTECCFYGGNKSERNKWLAEFQANDPSCTVMILNTAAGAESISCQDLDGNYPRYSIISPTWSGFKTTQVLGRPHRDGGKSTSVQHLVFAAGTIEERVAQRAQFKLESMTMLNDGDLIPPHLEALFAKPSGGQTITKERKQAISEFQRMLNSISDAVGDDDTE